MGIGSARGEDRAVQAAELAISSPLLEASIDGAHGVLLSIQGGSDLGLFEVHEAARLVQEAAHPEANIIFGTVIDDALGDEVRVTVIAAGFDGGLPKERKDSRALGQVSGAVGASAPATRSPATAPVPLPDVSDAARRAPEHHGVNGMPPSVPPAQQPSPVSTLPRVIDDEGSDDVPRTLDEPAVVVQGSFNRQEVAREQGERVEVPPLYDENPRRDLGGPGRPRLPEVIGRVLSHP